MLVSCLALILVALAGSLLALPSAGRGWTDLGGRLGQGYFIGMLLLGLCALAFERIAVTGYAWPLAALVTLAALFGFRRLLGQLRPAPWQGGKDLALGAIALAVLILLHLAFSLAEASQQPVFPWDAWETWLYRARAMFLHPGAHFVAPGQAGDTGVFVAPAAHYPLPLTAAVVWLARLHGEWSDPLLLVAWPFAWLALVGAFVPLVRERTVSARAALVLAAALASTPILTVHAALGGYMDLWMAGYVLIAAVTVASLVEKPVSGSATPVSKWTLRAKLALLVIAPAAVKVEGLVWVALLLLALAWAWSPKRLRAVAVAAVVLLLAVWFLPEGGLRLFDQQLVLARDFVRIPYLGETKLGLNPVLRPLWLSLFASATFGATCYLLIAAVLLAVVQRWRDDVRLAPGQALLVSFAVLSVAFVLVLFGYTTAGFWAENHTALSRVVLQLVPVWLLAIAPALGRALDRDAFQAPS